MDNTYYIEVLTAMVSHEMNLISDISERVTRMSELNEQREKILLSVNELYSDLKSYSSRSKLFEVKSDMVGIELTETQKLIVATDQFLKANKTSKKHTSISAYHSFQTGNLFVTSLMLYGLLLDSNNYDWVIPLIDDEDSGKAKLKKIGNKRMQIHNAALFVENFVRTQSESIAVSYNITGKILPKYDSVKGPSAYKSELKRTLLKGKVLRFKNQKALDETSKAILKAKNAKLRFLISDLRYSEAIKENGECLLDLSQDSSKLILTTNKGLSKTISKL